MVGAPGAFSQSPYTTGLPGVEMRRTFCSPIRRISSAHHSAHRFTSPACSGSALMLGIASSAFSSSRYRSRFTLMKSMTLSTKPPSIVLVDRSPLGLELLEVCADVLARRPQERGIEIIIDVFGDGLHRGSAGAQRGNHLLLAHQPMLDVARE